MSLEWTPSHQQKPRLSSHKCGELSVFCLLYLLSKFWSFSLKLPFDPSQMPFPLVVLYRTKNVKYDSSFSASYQFDLNRSHEKVIGEE